MKNQPTLFIQRLWNILTKGDNKIISWSVDGLSFVIKNQQAFQQQVLTSNFNHANYSSFIRQLNMYNFKKIKKNKKQQEFSHSLFRKNHQELLIGVVRKATQQDILYGKQLLRQAGLSQDVESYQKTDRNQRKKMNPQKLLIQSQQLQLRVIVNNPQSNLKTENEIFLQRQNRNVLLDSKDNTSQSLLSNNKQFLNSSCTSIPSLFASHPPYITNATSSFPKLNSLSIDNYYSPLFLPIPMCHSQANLMHHHPSILSQYSFPYYKQY